LGTWPSKCRERAVCSRTEKYRYYVFKCRKKSKKMYALRAMVCARRYAVLTRRERYL
jgi:hypothetical protein